MTTATDLPAPVRRTSLTLGLAALLARRPELREVVPYGAYLDQAVRDGL